MQKQHHDDCPQKRRESIGTQSFWNFLKHTFHWLLKSVTSCIVLIKLWAHTARLLLCCRSRVHTRLSEQTWDKNSGVCVCWWRITRTWGRERSHGWAGSRRSASPHHLHTHWVYTAPLSHGFLTDIVKERLWRTSVLKYCRPWVVSVSETEICPSRSWLFLYLLKNFVLYLTVLVLPL